MTTRTFLLFYDLTDNKRICSIGNVHQRITICWKSTHPQAIQDVDEFVSSSERILKNVALHYILTNASEC